jgi:FtsZ-interacting cell division protein ZipA
VSAGPIIAIVVVVLALLALAAWAARKAKARREPRRERMAEQAGGHRQESEAHAAKARVLTSERVARERELAQRHGEKAEDIGRKL